MCRFCPYEMTESQINAELTTDVSDERKRELVRELQYRMAMRAAAEHIGDIEVRTQ